MLGTILIVILLLALFGAWPSWPHSRNWGYYPSGGLGTGPLDRRHSRYFRQDLTVKVWHDVVS